MELTSASDGADIGSNSIARVSILPNDKPYGIIALESSEFSVTEEQSTAIFDVPITRRLIFPSFKFQ